MGSDSLFKFSTESLWARCFTARCLSTSFLAIAMLWVLLTRLQPSVPTFAAGKESSFPALPLPLHASQQQCDEVAAQFHRCQQNPKDGSSLVIACHRKWCDSTFLGGACEPCGGLGTRIRCMMGLAALAHEKCIRVELDMPDRALLMVDDAVYRDPLGYVAEMLHFRSYGDLSWSRTKWDGSTKLWEGRRTFLHGTPDGYLSDRSHYANGSGVFDYDPCLFHAIFRPSRSLQTDIERHLAKMGANTIGIHFRTGDAAAFGIANKDKRVSGDLRDAFEKVMECARNYARQLLPDRAKDAVFFLATDNSEVKKIAANNPSVYTTDIPLSSWLRADADYFAWLEIFLLSRTRGIVANRRIAKEYHGNSDRISTYAGLAAKVGFMTKDQLLQCNLGD